MARIKRNLPAVASGSTIIGHGGMELRRRNIPQTNDYVEVRFEMERSASDSYVITGGSWHGGQSQSYAAGMFSNISNTSNTQMTRKYGWSYIWGNTTGDVPQHLFSCMNTFTPGNVGTVTGTIKPGLGWQSSNGDTNKPAGHWNSNRSDDSRGNGSNAGFFYAFELDASRVSYSA